MSLIYLAVVICEVFATVEVASEMFNRCWKCVASDLTCCQKNTTMLRSPLIVTMIDPPTVRLGVVNSGSR